MKLLKSIPVLLFSFLALQSQAQPFLKKAPEKTLTFKEAQRQFRDWTVGKDLSKTRHWKYFKRMEMDMQMHTNAQGEPVDPTPYLQAAVTAAQQKEAAAEARFLNSTWVPAGPSAVPSNLTGYMENGIGRINCIAFHPNSPSTYFVGVAQGGVWKTTDNGVNWIPLTDNLPINRISDIAIDPNNPDVMYISVCDFAYIGAGLFLDGRKRNTHYGLGVYKTTNGGQTWNPTGLSFLQSSGDASLIKEILINPTNTSQLVACGVSGMYTSSNAGATWTKVVNKLFWDMVQHPTNPSILYAASGWVMSANSGEAGIYKSTDFGQTWNLQNTGIPTTGVVQRIKLAIAPSNPDVVYGIAVNTSRGMHGFYKTTNGGTTWQFVDPGLNVLESGEGFSNGGQGTYDLALMVSQTNSNMLYSGGVNIWGSTDGAQTFNPVSHWTTQYGPTLHGDIHFIETQPSTGNIFVCNDGGLYRTSNMAISSWTDVNSGSIWPTVWTNISNGMQATSFYRLSSSRNNTGRLVAGAQDNATFYFDGTSWSTIFGGDGMDNYLDPADDFSVMGSSQFGNFYLSSDGGQSAFGAFANVNNELAEWTTPLVADYTQPGTLYIGFQNVVKSTDNGNTWTQAGTLPGSFTNNEISALAVAPSNSQVLYAGKRVRYEFGTPGSLYKTTNGGNTWTNITAGAPDSLYYTSLDVHPVNASTAYVSMAGFSNGNKVFRTVNGGTTWQNISFDLPNIPVNVVKHVPNTEALMAGTDIGVYVLYPNATSWTFQSTGLPNVIVSDIDFNESLNKIYISTFGRGIWATDLDAFVNASESAFALTGVELFPSPNNGTFRIRFTEPASAPASLEVIDITGRIVHRATLAGTADDQVQLTAPNGLYYARITANGKSSVMKFVVQ